MPNGRRCRMRIFPQRSITASRQNLHEANYRPNGGYLAFVGRISPEKGPVDAIRISTSLGIPLKIAGQGGQARRILFPRGRATDAVDGRRRLHRRNQREGQGAVPAGRDQRWLFPICWPEPFGLVMIEAMACGTPVLAYRAGAVPEVVDEGITGMIVDNIDQARIASVQVSCAGSPQGAPPFRRALNRAPHGNRLRSSLSGPWSITAAQPGRSAKYPINGGARISGDELVSDVDMHAD